jgi:endonuclease/exonuclease/phosphatase family metal-dependent hydrolase
MLYKLFLLFFFVMGCIQGFTQKGNLRLISYNIRNGKGMDNITDYSRIANVFNNANADVIAVQEVDSITQRNKNLDVLAHLAKTTNLHGVYGAAIDYNGGRYGVGILSKHKALNYYTVPLPGREEKRVLLVAEFEQYVIFCTHLSLTEEDRLTSLATIDSQAARFTKPVYLLGDLNAEPSSPAINLLKKNWKLLTSDAPTFPATVPTKCIDYIFSRNCKKNVASTTVINEPVASDHRPVFVEIKQMQ